MGGRRATGAGNSVFMTNCCETRESRKFCGCGAWLDELAHSVVGDGRNSRIVKNCNDGAEFAGSVVLSRARSGFIVCSGSVFNQDRAGRQARGQ